MARNIILNYALLSVPCKYEPAKVAQEAMKNLCVGQPGQAAHDAQPLVMPKQCVKCGPITDFDVIVKGIKTGDQYAIVTQQDVADVKAKTAEKFKNKLDVVPWEASDFLTSTGQGASINYLTPAKGSEDHYALLVKLVEEHPEYAFAGQYTPVSKVGLFRLAVRNGVLVMEERTREQSMKPTPQVDGEVNEPMYDLLEMTLTKMAQAYDQQKFEDTYAVAVAQMALDAQDTVNVKAGTTSSSATVPVSDADLMAKLKVLAES